ncbi:MAG: FUN14 domain-containing protein [Candidatus Bathyarchaeia archaeon]
MEEILATALFMLVIGGVAGYFAGHLVKRASGMALTIGVIIFIIITLAYTGTFNVNLDSINMSITNFLGILTTLGIIATVSSVPFIVSFVAGLFIGYRRY